jgi:carotene isomerase
VNSELSNALLIGGGKQSPANFSLIPKYAMSKPEETEVIVIGSGIGGLCCAAMLAKYGVEVVVCESHSIPGGAAHGFERQGFKFDSGPSLYSGLSYRPSTNPLRHVLDAIEEELPCLPYDTWGCWLPEGQFDAQVGAEPFQQVLSQLRGPAAVAEWQTLQRVMEPLGKAAIAIPPAAMRFDAGAALTLGQFTPSFLPFLPQIIKLSGAFSPLLKGIITDSFTYNWLDLLCFMLSGLPAHSTSAAEMAFMFAEWYRPDVVLDYPVGGSAALVDALLRGLRRHGGQLQLNAHVEQIMIKENRAIGVQLRSGQVIRARQAVVSNATIWDTLKLLPGGSLPESFRRQRQFMPECNSFMHLHLGIDAQGIPADLACHHMVVNDWQVGVTAPQNVVAISIPSLLDPSLAPAGKHVIHAYTPATEPYDLWQGLDRQSAAYEQQKQVRAEVLWQGLERVIPDLRSPQRQPARCQVTLVGTPLTHERFLRRHRGSYGPALAAGQAIFPSPRTPVTGLLCCGDCTFPGIGLPAVAASGMMTANTLVPVHKQLQMLKAIR